MQPAFDAHDALVLYAALCAGDKGIASQGLVLLSDCVEHSPSSGQEVDKSLERLQEAHFLRKRGQLYLASREAVADCGPGIAGQPVPAAIAEVLRYLQARDRA
jgi:hypothetical protein